MKKRFVAGLLAVTLFVLFFVASCAKKVEENMLDPVTCSGYNTKEAREICLTSIGLESKDLSLCAGVKDRYSCYSLIWIESKDPSICTQPPEQSLKDECYLYESSITRDIKLCDVIVNPGTKDKCYNTLAIIKNDAGICDNIQNKAIFQECNSQLTSLQSSQEIKP